MRLRRGRRRDRGFLIVEETDEGTVVQLSSAVNGVLASFPFAKATKKTALRFAVGELGRRSTIWRVWPGHPKTDVYLASRKSAGVVKVSFHESGDWRLAWINPEHTGTARWQTLTDPETQGRVLHQWQRPKPQGGWTRAISIWIPHEDLVEIPGDAEPWEDVQWLQAPPDGAAVEVMLLLVRPGEAALELTSLMNENGGVFTLINGFELANGEVLVAVAATGALPALTREGIAQMREQARTSAPTDFDLAPELGPRQSLITVDADGHRNLWDLAARS